MGISRYFLIWVALSTVWIVGTYHFANKTKESSADSIEFLAGVYNKHCAGIKDDDLTDDGREYCSSLSETIQNVKEDPSIVSDQFSFTIVPLNELLLLMFGPPLLFMLLGSIGFYLVAMLRRYKT